jgi:hypothetical protein
MRASAVRFDTSLAGLDRRRTQALSSAIHFARECTRAGTSAVRLAGYRTRALCGIGSHKHRAYSRGQLCPWIGHRPHWIGHRAYSRPPFRARVFQVKDRSTAVHRSEARTSLRSQELCAGNSRAQANFAPANDRTCRVNRRRTSASHISVQSVESCGHSNRGRPRANDGTAQVNRHFAQA